MNEDLFRSEASEQSSESSMSQYEEEKRNSTSLAQKIVSGGLYRVDENSKEDESIVSEPESDAAKQA